MTFCTTAEQNLLLCLFIFISEKVLTKVEKHDIIAKHSKESGKNHKNGSKSGGENLIWRLKPLDKLKKM